LNLTHHALFVETEFVNDIATELRNYAASVGYNVGALGDQFFMDMAWGGLHETTVFGTKDINVQNKINARINAELTGNTQVYGNSNVQPMGSMACN
jgi:hypothetical protein